MTLAEQLRQEGRQTGREEGWQEGLKELAEAVRQIVDLEQMQNLQRASVTCSSFEEFTKAL